VTILALCRVGFEKPRFFVIVDRLESSYYIPDAYIMPILAAFRILVERARKCAWERDPFELR
jgi:hypothetical protein